LRSLAAFGHLGVLLCSGLPLSDMRTEGGERVRRALLRTCAEFCLQLGDAAARSCLMAKDAAGSAAVVNDMVEFANVLVKEDPASSRHAHAPAEQTSPRVLHDSQAPGAPPAHAGKQVCCVIKSRAVEARWEILSALEQAGVTCVQVVVVERAPAGLMPVFYAEHLGRPYCARLLESVSGPLVFVAGHARDVCAARLALGPTDPAQARETAPGSIRARFGTALPHNAVHMSDSAESGARELALLCARGVLLATPPSALENTAPVPAPGAGARAAE
jgi:nucleoside-diphosphate kinase